MKTHALAAILTAALVLGLVPANLPALSASDAAAQETGTIKGAVILEGARPKRRPIKIQGDPKCEAMHENDPLLSDSFVVNDEGQVQWVFAYIKNPPEGDYPIPSEPAVLDQQECRYTPHVQGMRAGQDLNIVNSDDLLHNVRSFGRRNRPFNLGQPKPGVRTKTISKPEKPLKFKCDIHKWMEAYIFAMDHPFFGTTNEKGLFTIENVPAGEYTIETWHEVMGEREVTVNVPAGGTADVKVVYRPPSKD